MFVSVPSVLAASGAQFKVTAVTSRTPAPIIARLAGAFSKAMRSDLVRVPQ
ncbi:hypothetical protein [Roseomonas xinghualingensis]|uniref:hypothetical protein n=1 Tax=Roseomonas xinghualingensis TaxID=2986475 RepID=UPI0021F24258|nr:hypothetical protein [Roseomonas sp. SXEYE001]MCV4207069.1 hypothetical protein [Roseomonas sp. SXEYE001]